MSLKEELADAPAVYSLFKDNLLLAYARRDVPEAGGAIRKASGKESVVLAPFAHGVIDCFDTKAAKHIVEHAAKADGFDALLFALKLDGFDVREGEIRPHGANWRF